MANPHKCPRCGSTKVRNSYYTDTAEFTGRVVGAIIGRTISLPFGRTANIIVGNAFENSGKMIGKALYDKRVCEDCKHSW